MVYFWRRSSFACLALGFTILTGVNASADQKYKTSGFCSPILSGGEKQIYASFKCTNNFGATVVYKLDESNTAILAKFLSVDAIAVANLMEQINGEHIEPYELVPHLVKLAEEVKFLRNQLGSYRYVAQAEALVKKIDEALASMDIDQAKLLYAKLINKFTEISLKQKSIENLLNIARSNTQLAQLEMSSYDYDNAFEHFHNAIDVMPGQFESELVRLKVDLAQAANLGRKHQDQSSKLVDQAEFLTQDLSKTDTTLFLRGIGLKLTDLVDKGKFLAAVNKFKKNVQPLLTEDTLRNNVDLKSLSLCIACLVNAANRVGQFETALKFSNIFIINFDKAGMQRPLDLVPVLINQSLTLAALGRLNETNITLTRAKNILEKYAPDGINPAYPDLWQNIMLAAENETIFIEAMKQLIVTALLNYKDDLETLPDFIAGVTGGNEGILCATSVAKYNKTASYQKFESNELAAFLPENCKFYQYTLTNGSNSIKVDWKLSDVADVESRVRAAYANTIASPDETINSALLVLCTNYIRNGWQSEGRGLCSKEILVTLKNSYASTSIAEATFQMAQFSYRLGYDFGIDDELLFRFSKEASEKANGGLSDKTLDATFLLAEFLKRTGQE